MNSINSENIAIAISTTNNGIPKNSTSLNIFMIEINIFRKNSNIILSLQIYFYNNKY